MNEETVLEASERFGTPLYLFDEEELLESVQRIRRALPERVSICFAMKANPFVVGSIEAQIERIEACSTGEMRICKLAGLPTKKLVVSGVHKDLGLEFELIGGGAQMCRYTVESVQQYEELERIAIALGVRVPILIRLSSGNQFGLDAEGTYRLIDRARQGELMDMRGIQFFSGTQNLSAERLRRELASLDAFVERLESELELEIAELEYGPGIPVMYFQHEGHELETTEETQLRVLGDALGQLRYRGKVIVEMGRAIAATCGTYLTRVVDTKSNYGRNYAIVDGGMHQIVYYGHSMGTGLAPCRFYPDRSDEGEAIWNICGSLCTTHDVLAKQVPCGSPRLGDVIAFEKAGAYCMTEGISIFLSRDLPRVVMVESDGRMTQVRDRLETYPINAADWENAQFGRK